MDIFEERCGDCDDRSGHWQPALRVAILMGGALACWSALGLLVLG